MKNNFILFFVSLSTCSLFAGNGSSFGAGFGGGLLGGMVGGAMTQPRTRTEVVQVERQAPAQDSYDDSGTVRRLRRQIDDLNQEIDELSSENSRLKKEIKQLKTNNERLISARQPARRP